MPLLTLYGPFAIHPYGLLIVTGISISLGFMYHDARRKALMSFDTLLTTTYVAILAGIVGARTLHILEEWSLLDQWYEIFAIWSGGLSIQGGVIGIIIGITSYLYYKKIPIFPFLDLACTYAPLIQSISRIGCFLAGCCFGTKAFVFWAITYKWDSLAPLAIPLHPAQLYSAFLLAIIFFTLYYLASYYSLKRGYILGMYLILTGLERFVVDFFRAQRPFFGEAHSLVIGYSLILYFLFLISFFISHYLFKKVYLETYLYSISLLCLLMTVFFYVPLKKYLFIFSVHQYISLVFIGIGIFLLKRRYYYPFLPALTLAFSFLAIALFYKDFISSFCWGYEYLIIVMAVTLLFFYRYVRSWTFSI